MMATRPAGRRGRGAASATGVPGAGRSGQGLSGRMVDRNLQDNARHAGPWIVWILLMIAGIILAAMTNTTTSEVLVCLLILVSTAGAVFSVSATTQHRSSVARGQAIATVVFAGLWLALVTLTGLAWIDRSGWHWAAGGWPVMLWLVCGGFLAGSWNVRIATHANDLAMAAAMGEQEPTDPWSRAGFVGVHHKMRKVNQFMEVGTVYLRGKGNTLAALQANTDEIELQHGWNHGAVKFMRHPMLLGSNRAKITVMHGDPLKDPVQWPGVDSEGRELAHA